MRLLFMERIFIPIVSSLGILSFTEITGLKYKDNWQRRLWVFNNRITKGNQTLVSTALENIDTTIKNRPWGFIYFLTHYERYNTLLKEVKLIVETLKK